MHRAEGKLSYEGRIISLRESVLVHRNISGPLVKKGMPVLIKDIVGVAGMSGQSPDDLIPIDCSGCYFILVEIRKGVETGQSVFISDSGVITDAQTASSKHFGYALEPIEGGTSSVIPVKLQGGC